MVGSTVGLRVCAIVGDPEGSSVTGVMEGRAGVLVGFSVGCGKGDTEGSKVGSFVTSIADECMKGLLLGIDVGRAVVE